MADQRIQTCDVYRTEPDLPHRFNDPDAFHGYSQKKGHPLYQTSNQSYGSKKPTVHEMPTMFKGTSSRFSAALLRGGMYSDHGFNTSVEKSRVTASTATQHHRANIHHTIHHHGNKHGIQDANVDK